MNPNSPDGAAELAAERFYAAHHAEHLSADRALLIDRCAAHLVETLGLSARMAQDIAMRVRADAEAATAPGYIDIDRSTGRMVMVHDSRSGKRLMFTVGDLLAYGDLMHAAGELEAVNAAARAGQATAWDEENQCPRAPR